MLTKKFQASHLLKIEQNRTFFCLNVIVNTSKELYLQWQASTRPNSKKSKAENVPAPTSIVADRSESRSKYLALSLTIHGGRDCWGTSPTFTGLRGVISSNPASGENVFFVF